jgi:hypothetical protein
VKAASHSTPGVSIGTLHADLEHHVAIGDQDGVCSAHVGDKV